MPRKCTICEHPQRSEIDAALAAGDPLRNIAKRFGTSTAALSRHKEHVTPKAETKAACDPINEEQPRMLIQKETGRVYPWTESLAARPDMEEVNGLKQCGACRFYLRGECRRFPPKIGDMNQTRWPKPGAMGWCGEWAAR